MIYMHPVSSMSSDPSHFPSLQRLLSVSDCIRFDIVQHHIQINVCRNRYVIDLLNRMYSEAFCEAERKKKFIQQTHPKTGSPAYTGKCHRLP